MKFIGKIILWIFGILGTMFAGAVLGAVARRHCEEELTVDTTEFAKTLGKLNNENWGIRVSEDEVWWNKKFEGES